MSKAFWQDQNISVFPLKLWRKSDFSDGFLPVPLATGSCFLRRVRAAGAHPTQRRRWPARGSRWESSVLALPGNLLPPAGSEHEQHRATTTPKQPLLPVRGAEATAAPQPEPARGPHEEGARGRSILPRVPQFKPGFTGGILCRVLRKADGSGESHARPVHGALLCSRGQKTVPTPATSPDTTPLFPGVRNAAPHSGSNASHHAAQLTCSIAFLAQNSPRWRQPAGAPEPQGRGGEGARGRGAPHPRDAPAKRAQQGPGLSPFPQQPRWLRWPQPGSPGRGEREQHPGTRDTASYPCTHADTCTSGQTTAHTGVLPSAASSSVHNTLTRLESRLKRLCCSNAPRPPDLAANRSRP